MEELFKNKTKYTQEMYETFLKDYNKEFSFSENLYNIYMFCFFLFVTVYAFFSKEIFLGIVLAIVFVIYIWFKFIRVARNVKKDMESEKMDGDFVNEYTFYKRYFKVKNPDGEKDIMYFKLYRVVETDENFYFYVSREAAFIVSKSGFEDGKSDEFSKFILKKVFTKYKNRKRLKSQKV